MSVRNRLLAGFGATAIGPVITALVQLISVPIFLKMWGPQLYGEWLVLSAVPTYLSITDMGFGSVAGNDMTMRVAAGDYQAAVKTFQSTWLLVSGLTLILAILVCAVTFMVPVTRILNLGQMNVLTARTVLVFLSLYGFGTLQASILMSGFRSDSQYSFGVSGLNVIRLLENAGMLALLWLGNGPARIALAAAAVRLTGTALLFLLLRKKLIWIRLGFAHASLERIRQLTKPAFAFMAFPAGNALSIQGTTVVIGILLGPLAVATFNPMRTLSRVAYQIIDSIKNAVWPELSAAYGIQNWELARKLHRSCCQIAFLLALAAVVALAITGPTIFRLWTHGRLSFDASCFYILLAVVMASSLWNTSSAVSIAANAHQKIAIQYLAGTAGSLLIGLMLIPIFGLTGAALSLLVCDIWMSCFVVRASNRLLQDDTPDFVRSMFSLSRIKLLVAR
jgi:O-antigen/teichoic acid export membrane protein